MNILLSLRFLVIGTIAAFIPMIAFADANLTPEQLVLLMKASPERYMSIDAKMKATSYKQVDENAEPELAMVREIVSRWSGEKSFSRIVKTHYPVLIPANAGRDYPATTIRTYAITPMRSKRLQEVPDGRIPRGIVSSGRSLAGEQAIVTVYDALWDFFNSPWEKMQLGEASVAVDEKSNCYIMKVRLGSAGGPLLALYVDPSKDFIPVKRELFKFDGTLLFTFECTDLHRTTNGLLLPQSYSWASPSDANEVYRVIYEVEQVTVNEPIADELLDFEFPDGTIVDDEICNVRYRVDRGMKAQGVIADACSPGPTDSGDANEVVGVPAKEEDLAAAAQKATELLRAEAVKEAGLPAIEVSPGFVMVTADKREYNLSVKKQDGTKPTLLNYRFEPDGLVLSSFKDLISQQNQLVVSIERLKSHTGFAQGTLLLQYADDGKPVKITFVSAALPTGQ